MLNITAFKTLIYSWNTSTWLPQFKKVREKSISSRSWKVRDFHIKSGKIYISESSQGKEIISSKYELLHLVWAPFMMTDHGTFLFWFSTSLDVLV